MYAFCAGEVARGEVVILASREDDGLLLAVFDFLANHIPNVLIEGLVLGLADEADLVSWKKVWIHHAVASSGADILEGLIPVALTSS